MNGKILFSEQQKFRQTWLWVLIIMALSIPVVIFIIRLIKPLGQGVPFENNPASNKEWIAESLVFLVCTVITILLCIIMRLETTITTEGVSVRFYPIHRSFRNYRWEDISVSIVRKYSPLKEFGGWGIRFGGWGIRFIGRRHTILNLIKRVSQSKIRFIGRHYTTAYSISGKHGLQLELKNGKRILIGTNKVYEIEQVLKKIEHIKNTNQLNTM
jgi:hypothetical protein